MMNSWQRTRYRSTSVVQPRDVLFTTWCLSGTPSRNSITDSFFSNFKKKKFTNGWNWYILCKGVATGSMSRCPAFFLQPTSGWDQNVLCQTTKSAQNDWICSKNIWFCTKNYRIFQKLKKKSEFSKIKNFKNFKKIKNHQILKKSAKSCCLSCFVFEFDLLVNFGLLWQPVGFGHRLIEPVATPLKGFYGYPSKKDFRNTKILFFAHFSWIDYSMDYFNSKSILKISGSSRFVFKDFPFWSREPSGSPQFPSGWTGYFITLAHFSWIDYSMDYFDSNGILKISSSSRFVFTGFAFGSRKPSGSTHFR